MGLTLVFEALGLSEENFAVYHALLRQPQLIRVAHRDQLAAATGLPAEQVDARLTQLRDLGLLVARFSSPDEEYPLHPQAGFEILVARRQQELDNLTSELNADRAAAGKFVADYTEFIVQHNAAGVEVLEGERAYQRMQHFSPVKSMWGMFPPADPMPKRDPEESGDQRLLDRGIDSRYLIVESQLKTSGMRGFIDFVHKYGGQIRALPTVPLKMIIFDGEAAVVGIDPDQNSVGAMVHHSKAVLRIAVDLFERCWADARPVTDGTADKHGEPTAQEAEFLRLLVRGATDEQVARKLGVSMRTVRRIAAKLSEQVGASGRFELGVRAAQRGWVD
ncbi:helix-turn-helix domain-containing protein [Kribbella sp. NPDC058693]|uniref:helix-turn-helix transcriptional regulator n=1 Tax=Kribbella sp. NPDC058693 TaxID=3346602 RepID=UPI00365042DE